MFCPYCGVQVPNEAQICPSCGAALPLSAPPVAPQYVPPQYVAPQYVAPQYVPPQYVPPQYVMPSADATPSAPVENEEQLQTPPSYATGYGVSSIAMPPVVSTPVVVPTAPVAPTPMVVPAAPVAPAPMVVPAAPVVPPPTYGTYPPPPQEPSSDVSSSAPPKPVEKIMDNPSYFDGGAFEWFFMNLAALLVSLITLTLLAPAMACWLERWRCEHTYLHGRRLLFDGKGIQLFGKRFVWLLLSIVTLGIYALFFLATAEQKWKISHTHFADQDGSIEVESYYDGGVLGRLGVNLFTSFVTIITLLLGTFWASCYRERWYKSHTVIDDCRLFFDGKGIQLFGKSVAWFFLTLITIGIFGFWIAVKSERWHVKHTHTSDVENLPPLKN